ncbi:hypothetical protein [Lentilactobacillus kosonis]|uniref:DUF4767 domain-containing protein n=1 Tax=Lentilactobacillus kosonis TaxID=2810561 RepID=A0A401FM92_9LACO|nr:hypothetical protein [Lentilactobacillus kosonis]GAY73457.1 hypothetical protein NBRC111893_1603 [Lentilactobacillus kosonis]
MKLKHLLLIGLSVLGLSSLSAVTTQADSTDPDAVMPYSLSKKEFNKIKKDYKGIWNNDKYYRVNKNVKISVNFMEPNEDVPTKYMNVTIPKGTILVGSRGYTNDSKKHISYVFSIDLDSLSYYVKTPKSSPNKDYEQQSAEVDSKSSATLNKYLLGYLNQNTCHHIHKET